MSHDFIRCAPLLPSTIARVREETYPILFDQAPNEHGQRVTRSFHGGDIVTVIANVGSIDKSRRHWVLVLTDNCQLGWMADSPLYLDVLVEPAWRP